MRPVADGYLVHLAGVDDREAAAALTLAEVRVARAALPPLGPGEYYVEDVVGCAVEDEDGRAAGRRARDVLERRPRRRDRRRRRRPRAPDPAGAGVRAERRRPRPVRCGCAGTTRTMSTTTTPAEAEPPRITFELVTLFPEMFDGLLATTVIGKAIAAGHRRGSPHQPARLRPRQLPPGRRHALRRRPGHDHARRADRGGAGRDRGGARPLAPHPAHAARAALRSGGGARAGGAAAHHAGLRALRGRRRARRRRWSTSSSASATSCWRAASWRRRSCSRRPRAWSRACSAAGCPRATNRSRPGASSTRSGRAPPTGTGQAVAARAAVGRPRGDRALAPAARRRG